LRQVTWVEALSLLWRQLSISAPVKPSDHDT
jgi:hypothetical protein